MSFTKTKMKYVSLLLPEQILNKLDEMVEQKYFPYRSEAIRAAIYAMLMMFNRMTERERHQFVRPPKKTKKIRIIK
jgi:metal-responsive CopG/Arc/MetJ family transcriptional regulator